MHVSDLFLSVEGRIGRRQCWIGMIAVWALSQAIEWMLGVPITSDPASQRLRIIAFMIGLLSIYPTAAIAVKRLHDRDQPGKYVWLLVAALASALVGDLFGVFADSAPVTPLRWLAIAVIGVVCLGYLIELGFRRGAPGPNRYGPDPLGDRG